MISKQQFTGEPLSLKITTTVASIISSVVNESVKEDVYSTVVSKVAPFRINISSVITSKTKEIK